MTLSEWLTKADLRQEDFGKRVGLSQGRISQIVKEGTTSLRTALAIERETDGEVTLRELLRETKGAAA